MNDLLRQYKFHKIIDYGTIAGGFIAIVSAKMLGEIKYSFGLVFAVFFYFYMARSTLVLVHYCFSKNIRKAILATPAEEFQSLKEDIAKKLQQYPSFSTTRAVFRMVSIFILLGIILGYSGNFLEGLLYAKMAVIPLCVIERLYLEKVSKFDVSGEYLIKMNEVRISGVDMPRSDDRKIGTGYRSLDPGNPSSRYFDTSSSTRNNIY